MEEVWKDVLGYEGLYKVSSSGRVKSVDRLVTKRWPDGRILPWNLQGKLLKVATNKVGYNIIALCQEGKCKTVSVHRLVAKAFLSTIDGKEIINHIDGVKTNNCISNLEWCNHSENVKHANHTGLNPILYGGDTSNTRPVVDMVTGETYATTKIAAAKLGISPKQLSRKLRGFLPNLTSFKFLNT
jgi:hypothetical protein